MDRTRNEIEQLRRIYPEMMANFKKIQDAAESDRRDAYKKGYSDASVEFAKHKSDILTRIEKLLNECAKNGSVVEKIAFARAAELVGDLL